MEKLTTEQRKDIIYNLLETFIEQTNLRQEQVVINCDKNTNVALIIEPRKHRFLEQVIRNVMYFVNANNDWNLHVVTCEETSIWLDQTFPSWKLRRTILNVSNLYQQQYNDLLMSKAFWNHIAEENILIFQTDAMMFRDNIAEFMHYDFIGANFFDKNDVSLHHGGNNGGFSFRHKSAMLDCLQNVSPQQVEQYLISHGKQIKPALMEDVYFTSACEILGKHMSSIEERKRFSIEDATKEHCLEPLGCHRFDSDQLCHVILEILSNCSLQTYLRNKRQT